MAPLDPSLITTDYLSNTYAASKVLNFSTNFTWVGIDYSLQILNRIKNRNGFMWNVVMRAFVEMGNSRDAILQYKKMGLDERVRPDKFTYPILIQGCVLHGLEFEGREIHGHAVKTGFDSDVYVANTLINMYGVCRNVMDARKVFDECSDRDLVSWNSLLAGYVQTGNVEEAKLVFGRMPERNLIASNSMIVLLGKTGHVVEARELFDHMNEKCMVSWSALISCYEKNEMYEEALLMFKEMCSNGIMVDEIIALTVLSSSANLGVVDVGKMIHSMAVKIGIASYVNLQNALIHMYCKCEVIKDAEKLFNAACPNLDLISWNSMITGYMRSGLVENARALFDSMPERDLVSWSAIIAGYAQHDCFSETLDLFQDMQLAHVQPDEAVLVSALSACTRLSALEQGKWVHAYIRKEGLMINGILGTTLIDMYMKCGCVQNALDVFHAMEDRTVSTWNALILGLAMNGLEEKSLTVFDDMKQSGILPNEITFIGVLGACRHMGLVDKGCLHFDSMTQEYHIKPNFKHYGCMVDLLGRAGKLKEAEELLESMPMAPDVSTWGALLGACKKYGDVERGERVGRKLIELQPDHDGFHIMLSNVYASKGSWEDVIDVRDVMVQQRLVKTPGCSMIEANGTVHEFLAGDRTHPEIKEIKQKLDEMVKKIKIEGYVPDKGEVFLEIDEEEKESSLLRHSEKLALAYGLLHAAPGAPIRIMKNLRICNMTVIQWLSLFQGLMIAKLSSEIDIGFTTSTRGTAHAWTFGSNVCQAMYYNNKKNKKEAFSSPM